MPPVLDVLIGRGPVNTPEMVVCHVELSVLARTDRKHELSGNDHDGAHVSCFLRAHESMHKRHEVSNGRVVRSPSVRNMFCERERDTNGEVARGFSPQDAFQGLVCDFAEPVGSLEFW